MQALYWLLSVGCCTGAVVAGLMMVSTPGGWTYPYQGLAVAGGVLAATFALLADRARRDQRPRGSA